MKLIIETPVKMRLLFDSSDEFSKATDSLTYQNKSVAYQIKQTKSMAHLYGEAWAANRVLELEQNLNECLIFNDENGPYTRPALLGYIQRRFDTEILSNAIVYPEFKLMPWAKEPDMEPYPYQLQAVDRLIEGKHAHAECATGTGKSFIIAMLTKRAGLPTIISTPSKSIARQLYEEFTVWFGKSKVGLFGDGKDDVGKHILICIGKSLSMVKPEDFHRFKKYDVFISDESHTLPADQFDYYSNEVLGHCPYRWYVSGTQERADGSELKLLSIIGPQVFSYSIQQGIQDGYLAKLDFMVFDVHSHSNFESGNLVRLNQAHIYQNERIAQVISDLAMQAVENNMPVLILIDEHSQEQLLRVHMKTDFVYASGKSKTHIICKDFNDGRIMCVVGNSAVSTGTNFRPVRLTINWQANKSGVKVKQGPIGRSTRIDKKTGKTECKVVDFRITNVPTLKRHANERIKYYEEIGDVQFVNFEEIFQAMSTVQPNGT